MIHPETERQLRPLRENLPGALLLQGVRGVGLKHIARKLADTRDTILIEPRLAGGAVSHNGTISIEVIRELYTDTRTRRQTPLVVIVDDADRMSPGAANAFLKLLEEPNVATRFILTSHQPQRLPATVRSRAQLVEILPLTLQQSNTLLHRLIPSDEQRRAQMRFIAAQLPAELHRLATDDTYFQHQSRLASDAKLLLEGTLSDRLALIAAYHTAETARQLSDMLLTLLRRLLSRQPTETNLRQLTKTLSLDDALAKNGNPRLQLLCYIV